MIVSRADFDNFDEFNTNYILYKFIPFRIFRIKDFSIERIPIYGDDNWINSTEVFPRRFKAVRNLYESEFIKVVLHNNLQTNQLVAIKFIKLFKSTCDLKIKNSQDRIEREIKIIQKLNHSYIIGFKEVIRLVDCVAIVMEYAENGELFDYVQKCRKIPESETKRIMFQIFLALDHMHFHRIVHRDLKLENILLDQDFGIKIADFGFANFLGSSDKNNCRIEDKLKILMTSCGSPCYAAPEIVLSNKGYSGYSVDIWSCGVIMFALLFGHLPFEDQAVSAGIHHPIKPRSSINVYQLYQYIAKNSLHIPLHTKVSLEATDLLKGMLKSNPDDRITLSEIFRHSWFANSTLCTHSLK